MTDPIEIIPISPTQVENVLRCERKWGWEYLEGIRGEPNEYANAGIKGHAHLQKWFTFGVRPDDSPEGQAATAALHIWPAPQEVYEVEKEIFATSPGGVWRYHGFQDIGFVDANGLYVVGDHKFTGDFKWVKTPDVLRKDPQVNIYSLAAMQRFGLNEVGIQWGYIRRNKPYRVHPVQLKVIRPDVEKYVLTVLDPIAAKIHQYKNTPGLKAMQLPPNATACEKYGGCPHIERCNLSPQERMRAIMAQEKTLAEKSAELLAARGLNPPENGKVVQLPTPPMMQAVPMPSAPMMPPTPMMQAVPMPSTPMMPAAPTGPMTPMDTKAFLEQSARARPVPMGPPPRTMPSAPMAAPVPTPIAAPVPPDVRASFAPMAAPVPMAPPMPTPMAPPMPAPMVAAAPRAPTPVVQPTPGTPFPGTTPMTAASMPASAPAPAPSAPPVPNEVRKPRETKSKSAGGITLLVRCRFVKRPEITGMIDGRELVDTAKSDGTSLKEKFASLEGVVFWESDVVLPPQELIDLATTVIQGG